MILQLKILKEVIFNKLKTTSLIFFLSLLLYFLIVVILNNGDELAFFRMFGLVCEKTSLEILLLLLNIVYIIYISYCFINYDIQNLYCEILLRSKYSIWIKNKIFTLFLFIIICRIIIYLFFIILNIFINNIWYLNFSFYINNCLMFVNISLIIFYFLFFKKR